EISFFKSAATDFIHEPTTPAALASLDCASRSSSISRSTLRRAASTSDSPATCSCANPSLQRRQDSAKAVGQLSRRLPSISTAKLPARRRRFSPELINFLIALRKLSKAE